MHTENVLRADEARLETLIATSAVPDLAEWAADYFINDRHWNRTEQSLRALVAGQGLVSQSALSEILLGVEGLTEALQRARGNQLTVARFRKLEPVGDEALDSLRRAVVEQRILLSNAYPMGVFAAKVKVEASADDLMLEVNFQGDLPLPSQTRPIVTLPSLAAWAQAPQLRCSCGKELCVHRALALDGLLEQTRQRYRKAAGRVERLLTPGWKRVLNALESPRPREEAPSPAILSVQLGGGQVEVSIHLIDRRGRLQYGVPLSQLSKDDWTRRFFGFDRRIAELWCLADYGGQDELGESLPPWRRTSNVFLGDMLLSLQGNAGAQVRYNSDEPAPVRVDTVRVTSTLENGRVAIRFLAGTEELYRLEGHESSRGLVLVRGSDHEVVLYVVVPEVVRLFEALHSNFEPDFPPEGFAALARYMPAVQPRAITEPESPSLENVAPIH